MIFKLSNISGTNFNRVVGFEDSANIQRVNINKNESGKFDELLRKKIESADVKFSAHAMERLRDRNIELKKDDISKLNKGIEKAQAKGSKESLILLNDIAMIVSVKNKTVITAVDSDNLRDNVFTNIDSAVILQ